MRSCLSLLLLAGLLAGGATLPAAERIPPAPARYFNDAIGLVSAATAADLNRQLEDYERESSNQLLVAIYSRMESDSSVEDYTVRVAQAWKAGQAGRNNGAVLFVFKEDRKLYLQVGYGLEATLTDARAHAIVENVLKPQFRAGNFDAGLRAAVAAMIAATKGEFAGTGSTRAESRNGQGGTAFVVLLVVIVCAFVLIVRLLRRGLRSQPMILGNPRRRSIVRQSPWWIGGGGGGWGSGSGGGGWSGGGGGGFSGGGGSFGGGGAGGSW